jgi:crotonobetainyl-CoA:carnitine CoA-transferase CaiB-like acyl-CoA transferase
MRVLDLSTGIAGAYCTKLLADYGARVIKLEPPQVGDPVRRRGPFPDDIYDSEKSGLFLFLNTNKEGITLNLESEAGRKLFRQICGNVDVVVENIGATEAKALGATYGSLSSEYPALVVTSLTDFGSDGPKRNHKMTNLIAFAVSGYMNPMGDPDRPPVQPGGPFSEFITGMFGCFGSLMAYISAMFTGEGQQVEVSRLEAVLASLIYDVTSYSVTGAPRKRQGRSYTNRQRLSLSVQPTRDDYIGFFVGPGYERWATLWEVLFEQPEVLEDERFQTPDGQEENFAELEEKAQSWLRQHDSEEIFHLAQSLRLLFAQFLTTEDLYNNEHLRARDYFQKVDHPVAGEVELPGLPLSFSATPAEAIKPAPTLGQHNERVYSEWLGLSIDEISRLSAEGTI